MELKFQTKEKSAGVYIISLIGSLDSNTSPELEREVDSLLKKTPDMLIFDMEYLKYLSSAGVRVLFKADRQMKKYGGKIMHMKLQPQIKKVFEIINALPYQKIFSSVQELDDYLDMMQKKVIKGDD